MACRYIFEAELSAFPARVAPHVPSLRKQEGDGGGLPPKPIYKPRPGLNVISFLSKPC